MDSDKQSQATLDLRKLFIQPYTPYRFSKNLINSNGERHYSRGLIDAPNET